MSKGKIIVIEGVDGVGKTTQYKLLCDRLEQDGIQIVKHKFPSYGKPHAKLVELYLSGFFGNVDEVSFKQASSYFGYDRFIEFNLNLRSLYNEGKILMLDRYTTSNMVHQACKTTDIKEIEIKTKWLENYEYGELKLPVPDHVFYLTASDHIIEKMMSLRKENDGIKNDILEIDSEYKKKVRKNGLICAQMYDWDIINIDDENGIDPRTREDIHEEIFQKVRKKIGF